MFSSMDNESNIFFVEVGVQTLLHKSWYLMNVLRIKNEVWMCNISIEWKNVAYMMV